MKPLYERYRPVDWPEVIGQPKAVAALRRLEAQPGGLRGKCYFLSGNTGTGKTTIARIISRSTGAWVVKEFDDPSQLTAEVLEQIRSWKECRPLGEGYCVIVNEAHGLRNDQVRKLLGLTESACDWITWVFTTTKAGSKALFDGCDDAFPLLHRCLAFTLTNQGLSSLFAERAREIAVAEKLDGQPIEEYKKLLARKDIGNSMRAALQAIEAGEMLA